MFPYKPPFSLYRFLILSDNKLIFNSILQTTYKWPEFYLSKVQLEYHNLRYTKEGLQLKHLLNECAIAKLFIPDLLKYEDAAVFMDADVLFLTSPENFWDEFKDFKDNHVASVSRNLLHLGNAEMNAVMSMLLVVIFLVKMSQSMRKNPACWP